MSASVTRTERAGETRLAVNTRTVRCRIFFRETLHYVNWNSPTALVPRSCKFVILQVRGDRFFLFLFQNVVTPLTLSTDVRYLSCLCCIQRTYRSYFIFTLISYNSKLSFKLNKVPLYNVKDKKKIVREFCWTKIWRDTGFASKENMSFFVHFIQLIGSS